METYQPTKVRLRLNTSATNDTERWRLEMDNVEVKVAYVQFIGCEVVTEEMTLDTGEIKYCIACNDADFVHITNGVAAITKYSEFYSMTQNLEFDLQAVIRKHQHEAYHINYGTEGFCRFCFEDNAMEREISEKNLMLKKYIHEEK